MKFPFLASQIFSACVLGASLFTGASAFAQAADLDDPKAFADIPREITDSANQAASTGANLDQKISDNVLDKLAIQAARLVAQKLNSSVLAWAQGGFKGAPKLYVDSFTDLLQGPGDQALRMGLTELNKRAFTSYEFDPNAEGYREVVYDTTDIPLWIEEYLIDAFPSRTLDDFILGMGIKELTNFCTGTGEDGGCADPQRIANSVCSGLGSPDEEECYMELTEWEYSIALKNGFNLKFVSTGWNFDPDLAEPSGDSFISVDNGKPSEEQVQLTEKGNQFAAQVTESVVKSYNSTLAGTVQTTLAEELGDDWKNFAVDATIGFDTFNAYGGWDALSRAGNNPVGTTYAAAGRIALSADQKLNAVLTEVTSPGFLADKVCQEEGEMEYPDGTKETFCKVFTSNNPAGVVGDTVSGAITKAFDVSDITKWEQLGVELLAGLAGSVIEGGLQYAGGEIRSRSQEVVAEIRQLGPFSTLYGEIANEIGVGDENAWQLLGDRSVDFSNLNREINATAEEYKLIQQAADALRNLSAPTLVLDQECVMGPDLNWEQRLRSNNRADVEVLRKEVLSATNDSAKSNAQQQLLSDIESELERQITFVKEALPDNPFRFQNDFLSLVEGSAKQVTRSQSLQEQASEKQNTLDNLLKVRELLTRLGEDADILTTQPPTWDPDIDNVLTGGGIGTFGNLNIDNTARSEQELRDYIERSQENGLSTNLTTANFNAPIVTAPQRYVTVPHQDQEESVFFNILQNVGISDTEDSATPTGQEDLEQSVFDDIEVIRYDNIQGLLSGGTTGAVVRVQEPNGGPTDYFVDFERSFNYTTDPLPEPDGKSGIYINITESYEAPTSTYTGEPFTAGYNYAVNYKATDSDGNEGSATRIFSVKSYDQHLISLSRYNEDLQSFINEIAESSSVKRAQLSRIVNLYLAVEKTIGSDTSVRAAQSEVERADQLEETLFDALDRCYLELWKLDKIIPDEEYPEAFTAINNTPFYVDSGNERTRVESRVDVINHTNQDLSVNQLPSYFGGVSPSDWASFQNTLSQKTRVDSRIPYIDRTIDVNSKKDQFAYGSAAETAQSAVQRASSAIFSITPAGIALDLWRKLDNESGEGAGKIISFLQQPNTVSTQVPDFRCTLDNETLKSLPSDPTAQESILQMYQDYHCISTFNPATVSTVIKDIRRYKDSGQSALSETSPAYRLGRLTIGQHNFYRSLPFEEFPNENSGADTENYILSQHASPATGLCEDAPYDFRVEVLGSQISCDHYGGTLVHVTPSYPADEIVEGLSMNNENLPNNDAEWFAKFHPLFLNHPDTLRNGNPFPNVPHYYSPQPLYSDEYSTENPNIARSNNYTYPYSGESVDPETGKPVIRKVYSIDVYRENTERRLYCRHRTILFQGIRNHAELFDVGSSFLNFGNNGGQDGWWTGDFDEDGKPILNDIGNATYLWGTVQSCSDWTESDLSTYLEYPKILND